MCIPLCKFNKLELFAATRGCHANFGSMLACKLFGEPLAHCLEVFGKRAHDDLVRQRLGCVVVAEQEHVDQVDVGNVKATVEHKFAGVEYAAFADHEHMRASYRLFAVEANDVGVQII